MKFLKKIGAFILRDFNISIKTYNDLLISLLFFFISIFVFIFAIGSNKEILQTIGVGILWSLLLLSSTLSLRKYYQEDFDNGSLIIIHMSGLSYELISILRIISNFLYVQIPFLFSIPIASIFINLSIDKIILFLISFVIGSLILSCLGSISSSMNLLNKSNFSLGGIIVMIFSIPVIIFGVGIINFENNFYAQVNILLGILLIFLSVSPLASALCIKLALENK
tara:strand:- start:825 stop:1496 length:672 start_codon:yes stop_codon:yes gene_type:complete